MRMRSEILEEPDSVLRTFKSVKNNMHDLMDELMNSRNVLITGDGTSFHASLYLERILGNHCARAFPATEIHNHMPEKMERTICILFSQSGENSDVLLAARKCIEKGGKIVSVVNREGSSLENISSMVFHLKAGEELAVPATKSYVSMLTFSYTLHSFLRGRDAEESINKICAEMKKIMGSEESFRKISESAGNVIFIIASGIDFVTGMEASLKIMETAGRISIPFYSGEVFHGPIEIFDRNSTAFVIRSDGIGMDYLDKIRKYTTVFSIGDDDFDDIILKPPDRESGPILNIVPFQIISWQIASATGRNPDHPQRLKKVYHS